MKEVDVECHYIVKKIVTVVVPDDGDPLNESQWEEITCEHDVDTWLYDVIGLADEKLIGWGRQKGYGRKPSLENNE